MGNKGLRMCMWLSWKALGEGYDMIYYACLFSLSSPFLFVFDDDRVTYHTGAHDIVGDVVDA